MVEKRVALIDKCGLLLPFEDYYKKKAVISDSLFLFKISFLLNDYLSNLVIDSQKIQAFRVISQVNFFLMT